jgi:hypothetical protein
MANPIPTQLSPGVKVSEVDLSQFVQLESLNTAGMVGIFNWGPGSIATSVNSESNLAAIFGKPTLDPSDSTTESDFFAAANFLRYSSHLKVIRVIQAGDANAASEDVGVTGINNCDNRIISNHEEFVQLGGFSASAGIESLAHFRARYPGNFGDTFKVVVFDGATGETIITDTAGLQDFNLFGGYNNIIGISGGTCGFSLNAQRSNFINFEDFDGNVTEVSAPVSMGSTSGIINWYTVTITPPSNMTPTEFINTIGTDDNFNFLYATGTTTANYALTNSGTNPSGNNSNCFAADWEYPFTMERNVNPFAEFGVSPTTLFAAVSSLNASAVDLLFLDANDTNMGGWVIGQDTGFKHTSNGRPSLINQISHPTTSGSGLPTNFNRSIFNQSQADTPANTTSFFLYRNVWGPSIGTPVFPNSPNSSASPRGWFKFIGLTGGQLVNRWVDGNLTQVGVTFDLVGGLTGIKKDFQFGMKQLGNFGLGTQSETTESYDGYRIFDKMPGTSEAALAVGGSNDEISIAVLDTKGKFGPKNGLLERFELLSKAADGKNLDGQSVFYKDYVNNNSQFVYLTKAFDLEAGDHTSNLTTAFGDITSETKGADGITFTRTGYYDRQFAFGESSASAVTVAEHIAAYSTFLDDDSAVDIIFIPESSVADDVDGSMATIEKLVFDTVIEPRKDTILVVSTPKPASSTQHTAMATSRAISYRKNQLGLPSNSYTVLVAGRKIFFDTFNNQLRRLSLASDVAGIMSGQEIPWESPAGFARGSLRNVIKLETLFSKTDRDELYKNQINFFTQFNDGSGTVLYGDKTLLTKPSAFDRINVRRVFIAAEKAIAKAAKYSLFEFNDEFTRSQFRNLVNPFLANLQSQRGIADFRVVCDATNNPGSVVDLNQFVADIYIKPLKSINFIQLNFIATRSDFSLTTIE